ncbi:MAG: C39 family peptidase [Pseudomonas sp.]
MRTHCAALLLLILATPTLFAGQQALPVLPGGGLVFKPVESFRERRFANLVEQKTDFSCGAAAVATLLNQAYGMQMSEATVILGMLHNADLDLVRSQGFSMLDMKRYATALGLRVRGYRIKAEQLESVRIPSIVLVDIRGYKHFVVMQRSQNGWIYLGDPVLGHKRMSLEEFAKGWNGIVLAFIGPGYDRDNRLLNPPEPLTARDRLNRFKPLQDAELMEFGFIQSDFF